MPFDRVIARPEKAFHERCDFPSQDIVHFQCRMHRDRDVKTDDCGRIERVGEILE